MQKKRIASVVLILLTLFWLSVIYGFSGEDSTSSDQTSGKVTETVLTVTVKNFKEKSASEKDALIKKYNHPIRKLAHFSEYAVLGVLVCLTVLSFIGPSRALAFYSLLCCIFFSSADEFIQRFMPGRSCRLTDVLIDSSGALLGITLTAILIYLLKRKKYRA